MKANLDHLRIFDMTNWPFTLSPNKVKEFSQILPIELLGFSEEGPDGESKALC
jgi:hypothetical protein